MLHRAYNTYLDAHPRVSDDGVSITKCLTEHIVMILMLIDFAYHVIKEEAHQRRVILVSEMFEEH